MHCLEEVDMMRRMVQYIAMILWFCGVCAGLKQLWRYEATAGVAAPSTAVWPSDSRIPRQAGKATLILFAHPRCPCTRATIGELNALMTHCQGRVTGYVLFYRPVRF